MLMRISVVEVGKKGIHNEYNAGNQNGIDGVEEDMKLGYGNAINLHAVDIKGAVGDEFL